jgi:hypothetical protein
MMKVEEKVMRVWDAHTGQCMLTLSEWKVEASSRQDQMMSLVRWEGTIGTVSVMRRISDDD